MLSYCPSNNCCVNSSITRVLFWLIVDPLVPSLVSHDHDCIMPIFHCSWYSITFSHSKMHCLYARRIYICIMWINFKVTARLQNINNSFHGILVENHVEKVRSRKRQDAAAYLDAIYRSCIKCEMRKCEEWFNLCVLIFFQTTISQSVSLFWPLSVPFIIFLHCCCQ